MRDESLRLYFFCADGFKDELAGVDDNVDGGVDLRGDAGHLLLQHGEPFAPAPCDLGRGPGATLAATQGAAASPGQASAPTTTLTAAILLLITQWR